MNSNLADLRSFIDGVLRTAQDRGTPGRWQGANWVPGSEVDADEAEKRKRRGKLLDSESELDKQRLVNSGQADVQNLRNTGEMGVQGLRNTGALNVERESNSGTLARQRLMNTGSENVANITASAHKYGADVGLEGHKYNADASVRSQEIAGKTSRDVATIGLGQAGKDPASAFIHEAIKNDPAIATDPERWKILLNNSRQLKAAPPTAESARALDLPDTGKASPVETPLAVTPARASLAAPAVTPPVAAPTTSARASLAAPKDPIAEQLAAERLEERRRAKQRLKSLSDFFPTFRNNVDPRLSY